MWPFTPRYPERRAAEVDSNAYDYIILGGGTAGCVLASRLSEDPNISVLVLERGIANNTWMSRIPLISANIFDSAYGAVNWDCEPMKNCDNRQAWVVCGEALGGSSRINSMVYSRGGAAEYDAWGAMGHSEWSYEKVLPYFVKAENSLSTPESRYRGKKGPWINQTIHHINWPFRICRVLRECGLDMGFPWIPDINSPDAARDGFTAFDLTFENKERLSTFHAFLPLETARKRKNLTICTGAIVSRIVFSGDSKEHRAETVQFQDIKAKSRKVFSAQVNREVVLCSGAIGSPQTLMLSGIGPREHLEEQGIEIVRDLPGVGSELSDHMAMPVNWEVPIKESVNQIATSPLRAVIEFLKYLLFRTGILSIPFQTFSIFVRSTALNKSSELIAAPPSRSSKKKGNITIDDLDEKIPDIELMPLATSGADNLEDHHKIFSKIGIFCFLATVLQPRSRGTVRLASSKPLDRPKVEHGFLDSPADYAVARIAVRLALKLGEKIRETGFPLLRGVAVPDGDSDEDVDRFIRRRARTTYHYSSTCRMADEFDGEAPGVVDSELRVHGVSNLRVCDASVFPRIIATHLQAPVVMVAEKCADIIRSRLSKEI